MSQTEKRTYVAGFMTGDNITIEAESLWDAKQKAVAHFKPRKKDMGLVWVQLADVPITPDF